MKIYLLDKNVVEDIKASIKGIPTAGVAFARSIDRKGNIVSSLLATMEGCKQRAQSGSEFHDQLMVDSQSVGMFYRWARTDSEYLRTFASSAVAAFAPHMREKANALVPLAMRLQALVVHQRKWEEARTMLSKLDELAAEHDVNLSHPLLICAIACLYGSRPARRVLKPAVSPTHEGAYNAITDIRLVMEVAYVRKMMADRIPRAIVRLHTSDKPLNALARIIDIRVETSYAIDDLAHEIVSFSSTLSKDLLPNLQAQPKEMERVLSYLSASRNCDQSLLA